MMTMSKKVITPIKVAKFVPKGLQVLKESFVLVLSAEKIAL